MPPISDIVNITISRDTLPPARSSFGVLLIAGDSGKLREFDIVYLDIDAQFVASNVINGKVNGVAITPVNWTTDSDTTMGLLATELASKAAITSSVASDNGAVGYNNRLTNTAATKDVQLQLSDFVVTGGASQATITITRLAFQRTQAYESLAGVGADFATTDPEYIAASDFFAQSPNPGYLKIGRVDSGEDWDDALDAIVAVDDVWYMVAITERTIADQEDVADWAETRKKVFAIGSADANILVGGATSDIAYYVSNADYDRSFVIYHHDAATEYPECAWAGLMLTYDPGKATWKFKELTGFEASTLTDAQRTAAKTTKKANVIETYGDRDITAEGTCGSGEFIDVIRFIDWLESDMSTNIYEALATAPKIPYTDAGVAVVEAEVRASLDDGLAVGGLRADPDAYEGQPYRVTTKKVADISAADRANRFLPGDAITFDCKLAGAVHSVAINGVVAV